MKFNPPVLKRMPASETFMAAVGCVHQDGFNQPQCGKPVLKQAPNGLLCGAHDRDVFPRPLYKLVGPDQYEKVTSVTRFDHARERGSQLGV